MSVLAGHPSRLARRGFGLLGALGVGALLAAQSRINGELGARLGSGLAAAVVSFGVGLVLLGIGSVATAPGRDGVRRLGAQLRTGGLRPWQCLGGLCGGYLVCAQGLTVGLLGVALFTVSVVAGQVVSGLLVDRWGLGPGGRQLITGPRIIGSVLALLAVLVAVSTSLGSANASWLVLLPLVAGVGTAWQQAVNGRVRQGTESTLTATLLNFGTGTAGIVLALLVEIVLRGAPNSPPGEIGLYLGGVLGIGVIGGSVLIVQHTGVLLLSMGTVGGQLIGAALLDTFVPAPGTTLRTATLVGVVLTLVAVGIASWPSRAARGSTDLPR